MNRDLPMDVIAPRKRTLRERMRTIRWRRHWLRVLLVVAIGLASLYWGAIESDQYVSEAHIVVTRTSVEANEAASGLLSLISGSSSSRDMMLFRDRLLSLDMIRKLDHRLGMRAHYSDRKHDWLSILWDRKAADEEFQRYLLGRVSVTYDDYSQNLVVTAQAYTPQMAQAIVRMMVDEGESDLNRMDNAVAEQQVSFIENELVSIRDRMFAAQKRLLAFQNENGLASPLATAQGVSEVVERLESERSQLEAKKLAMLGYLTPQAPDIVQIEGQIAALQQQINVERNRVASKNGTALNHLAEEQHRLQVEATFAEDVYKTGLAALEKARVDATRKIKSVQVLQSPSLPQASMQPRRLYNIIVFIIVSLLVAGVIHLIGAIIRDHRD
ncbi:chain-length determining protein [Caballeronia sp. LZ029]|uniref:chain-length determining protein n=1 Tax=Caballeronia sp. LZ029 TaxID=3038564 RepID=UPI0028657D51|nr:chain-length determining protein [Caballeronia sp. LZ029]MDR5744497.1 chain-length determining protein [Caballeronia sp. LZ029]